MADLASVLQAITGGGMQNLPAAFGVKQSGIIAEGDATQRAALAKGEIDVRNEAGIAQAQQQNQQAATNLGSNMSQTGSLTVELGNILRQSVTDLNKQQAVVSNIEANSDLLTNPLGWLDDLVRGDAERAKLKALQGQADTAQKSLQALNQATQQTAATNLAIAVTKDESTVLAQQKLAAATADAAAAATQTKLGGTAVDFLVTQQNFNHQQASMALQLRNAAAADEQRLWMREQRELDRQLRIEQRVVDENLLAIRNAGAADLNVAPVANIAGFKAMMSLDKELESKLIARGQALQKGFKNIPLASTTTESFAAAQAMNVPLSPNEVQLARKVAAVAPNALTKEAIQELYPNMKQQDVLALMQDKKRQPELVNQYIESQAKKQQALVKPGDPTNWYAPASIGTLANQPYMKQNPFLNAVVLPSAVAAPDTAFDPSALLAQGMEQIDKGMASKDVVEGVAWMATQLVNQATATTNYTRYALPPMTGLKMPLLIDSGSRFTSNVSGVIDVTQASEVNRLLLQGMTARKKQGSWLAPSFGQIINESMQRDQTR